MRRLLPLVAVALAAAVVPATASGQVFSVVRGGGQPALPSFTQPNGPGSIAVPLDLAAPPEQPAVRSYEQLLGLWHEAGAAYGVPWQVLAAINKIESNFGQNMGPSSAGALGWMQFIPSSWMRWGMDGDGDGLADPWDPEDAVYSAARYLAAAGAHEDLERAIFAYNHAQWYVDDVVELAALFGDDPLAPGGGALVFALGALEEELASARAQVAHLQREIAGAAERGDRAAAERAPLELSLGDPSLSDKRFRRIDARLRGLERVEDEAAARRARLEARLARVLARIDGLEQERAGAALASPGAFAGGGPASAGGYVFPVGGGPSLVSVAHVHHDYPAADIAAPEGSPLYALADAVVLDVYPEDRGKCGIGLKLAVQGGPVFVYCHLSYLEPHVVPGTALAAGAPVGLVGSTGNSTGPHLHLGFVPSLSYPQEEPWFRAFAGVAFSWQDAATPAAKGRAEAGTGEPVFRVVRTRVIGFRPTG